MRPNMAALVALSLAAACRTTHRSPDASAIRALNVARADTIQRQNDASARQVLLSIAGREREPASKVFDNVKFLASTPAQLLVQIMNEGYAKALGVTCTHCHVEGDYASDDKRPKRAAREMQLMHRMFNEELAKMQYARTPASANRAISCIACHRGTINPNAP